MKALVELKQVSKRYASTPVFEGLSLDIQPGQHFALLGASGCGKSTLLRLIAGLDSPTSGQIWLDGRLASEPGRALAPPHQRGLAMVFQDLALWPNLTALENVELGLAGAQLTRRDRLERARSTLQACRIADLADRKPAELSGGEQQRTALARALAVQPKLLLLDEPFSDLDIALKGHLYTEIAGLCQRFQLTVILVSHDPMEATALCSHAAVIEGGEIREKGAFEDLLRKPVSETLRAFVEQLPGTRRRPHDDEAAR